MNGWKILEITEKQPTPVQILDVTYFDDQKERDYVVV